MPTHRARRLALPFALLPILLTVVPVLSQDYGVPVDSYPSWQERVMEVATNACRMAPTDFRDSHTQYPDILSPTWYPAVAPIVWCEELNRAARFHSEDMAYCNLLQHDSCDGTTTFVRIATFYPYGGWRGESIAGFVSSPFDAVVMWIEDEGYADGSGYDGHRANIMKTVFTEGGGGYCYAPGTSYHYLYTFDYGGRDLGDPPALVDGAHLYLEAGTTTFWANWYQPDKGAPVSARVYIDGERHDLQLHLGTTATGTWATATTTAAACRSYVFQFVDAGGDVHWYPQAGQLRTWGEGGSTDDYLAGATGVPQVLRGRAVIESIAPNPFNPQTVIRFDLDRDSDVRMLVLDARGRLVRTLSVGTLATGPHAVTWDGRDDAGSSVGSGVYFVQLSDGAGVVQSRKLTLLK